MELNRTNHTEIKNVPYTEVLFAEKREIETVNKMYDYDRGNNRRYSRFSI